ncbi:MAG: hypothetical protein EOM80_11470 [Erysipelotrichia bacterium]|nr:hypothetical protein [Erysipelotrichia bacterium]
MSRKGASLYEILALIIIIAAAYLGDAVGCRYGNVFGIVGMIVFPLILIFFIEKLAWLEREFFIGQRPFPPCRCGRSIDEIPEEEHDKHSLRVCRCGLKFNTSGRGVIFVIENSNEETYAVWRPFKGWQLKTDK